jgi:spore coat polysaccharide biosynthesis protein SpsF
MRVIATVEARMSSTRLPGKTLMTIAGKTLLELVVERLRSAKKVDEVVIATTSNPRDDAIVSFCKQHNIAVFRGSEEDVLGRVYEAAKTFKADLIVQAGADSPFYDPVLLDTLIGIYQNGTYAYVANDMKLTFPEGVDAHIMSMKILKEIHLFATKPRDRDDVPRYIWDHPEQYPIFNLEAPPGLNRPDIRLTLDYEEDLILTRKIYDVLYSEDHPFTTEDVIDFLDKNPELKTINAKCEQHSAAYLPQVR